VNSWILQKKCLAQELNDPLNKPESKSPSIVVLAKQDSAKGSGQNASSRSMALQQSRYSAAITMANLLDFHSRIGNQLNP
jgi:hypothetical protein